MAMLSEKFPAFFVSHTYLTSGEFSYGTRCPDEVSGAGPAFY
jgi:hypothetical protein